MVVALLLFPLAVPAEPVTESLEDMPWFEAPRDDYKEYTAEEVREYIPDETEAPELEMPGAPPGIPTGLQEIILLFFLGLLIFFAVYLAYRWYREHEPAPALAVRPRPRDPEVLELPGLDEAVPPEVDLRQAIRSCLREGREGKAVTYIFVLLLRELSDREHLVLRKYATAREYMRDIAASTSVAVRMRELFAEAARAFERVVYGESAPGLDVGGLWNGVEDELKRLAVNGEGAR